LLREFGSMRGVVQAPTADLAKVVGATRAQAIRSALG
jgi:excinuclease UvrABC nuclease subunit